MTSQERRAAMEKLEAIVERAVHAGWTLESLSTLDETDEPFRAEIHLRIESASVLGGML